MIMREFDISELISRMADTTVETVYGVPGGLSDSLKYKVKFNNRWWMVKITDGSTARLRWYKELSKFANEYLIVPEIYGLVDENKLCLISPWIDGDSLDVTLSWSNKNDINDYGHQAALLIKRLHRKTIHAPYYSDTIQKKVEKICAEVIELKLDFPGREECCNYINNYAQKITVSETCLLHRDIRPENFIVCNHHVYLIDFDNGGVGEAASDFAYLTTMGAEEHRTFSKSLISKYLEYCDEAGFWEKNLFYSTLQVMEYAIWKWKTKKRQINRQANNLLQQYSHFQSIVPDWWEHV